MVVFIIQPEFFDLITDDTTILERDPLEEVARKGELMAYLHDGFGSVWIQSGIVIH